MAKFLSVRFFLLPVSLNPQGLGPGIHRPGSALLGGRGGGLQNLGGRSFPGPPPPAVHAHAHAPGPQCSDQRSGPCFLCPLPGVFLIT